MSADNNPLDPNMDDVSGDPELEKYVNSPEFDLKCTEIAQSRERAAVSLDESSDSDSDSICFQETDSSPTTVGADPHDVSKVEAHLYYAGVRGNRGPKLVWRDSPDKFEEPSGPDAYKRLMKIVPVPDDHEFGVDGLWDRVRDHVVKLLKRKGVKVSVVDFVRFTWLNQKPGQVIIDDDEEDEDEDEGKGEDAKEEEVNLEDYDKIAPIQPVEDGDRHYTNPTIWIGVLPDTLTGSAAYDAAKDIRAYLNELPVQNIDIAFREAKFKFLTGHGPALYRASEDGDALQPVIDNLSVPLSLYIAGKKTTMQGTLGPYFHANNKLYAITVRHNLFTLDDDNAEYRYNTSAPKKEVLLMGEVAFTNYKSSIQAHIGTLIDAKKSLEKRVETFTARVANDSRVKLTENESELSKTRRHIDELKRFFLVINKKWNKPKDRVIGHVVWAPSIGVGAAPHGYTRDLCVVELYKDRFRNMTGNVLSLGTKYTSSKLNSLIYGRTDVPSEFKYPEHGLLNLRSILTADQVKNPNSKDTHGDCARRVFKRGYKTDLTLGTLVGKFMSYARKYFPTGDQESLELPILNHEEEPGTFSRGGDSGSLIVTIIGQFVALLTGRSNKGTDGSDITYATLFEWIWELVCQEFPGANLYFEDLEAFFADVAT
ncbi:hypothetical protein F5I97DRAFT_1291768 [Phlebopus sp. FC_14]|nr:hypothetical protein F5I97DRAFT_1291768 [Phlebopus sp. FC_14]